ncbi:hypothetical protein, partial [Rhodospirillaceae bacterium SYSU D60014]|uniref:hypothetical protein n=1 Tax=Virgifigura deserti TaxID=2268457 RepID=UPI0013C3FBBA
MRHVLSGHHHGTAVIRSSATILKRSSSVIALTFAIGLAAPALAGPITATWNGGAGNWMDSNWSFDASAGSTFPRNDATDQYNVRIDGGNTGTASAVTLTAPATIDSLDVDTDDSLLVEGTGLTIVRDPSRPASGSVQNSGSITVEAQGIGFARLRLESDVTFDGGGVLTLAGPA